MSDDEPVDDPDRAAILARRQRFIAIALSGLAGTAACDKPSPGPITPTTTEGKDDGGETPPQPCLNVAAPEPPETPPPETPPQACLDVAVPQPCLSPPAQPCLQVVAPPQPCLEIAVPPEKPPPRPQPCLDVGPPQPDPPPKPEKAPPRPCLKVKPRPCLDVAPQVCLNFVAPDRSDDHDE